VSVRSWTPFTFWRWISLSMASYGVTQAILVVLAGLALNLRHRRWLLPYFLLLGCGFVGATLVYWARKSYDRPKSGAIRFAAAVFLFSSLYMGALLVSVVKLGMLSSNSALNEYAPYVLPTSTLGSIAVYFMMRKKLEATKH